MLTDEMKRERIPIRIEWQGKWYNGEFGYVHGVGRDKWSLTVNNYDWGDLFIRMLVPDRQPVDFKRLHEYERVWVFASFDGRLEDQADFFGDYITAWYC